MSPEQAWGNPVDFRADLFSLGVLLYKIATGRLPFQGANTRTSLALLTTVNPTPPREINPDLPPSLDTLIRALLSKDPSDRPPSAEAVAESLQKIEQGLAPVQVIPLDSIMGANAGPNPWADIAATEVITGASAGRIHVQPPSERSKHAWLLWALFGLVVLAGGGLLAAKLFKSTEPRGILYVETDDPNLEIVVLQNGQAIRERTREREFALSPGEYTVEPADRSTGLKVRPEKIAPLTWWKSPPAISPRTRSSPAFARLPI